MNELLKALYDSFYEKPTATQLKAEIECCHQELIENPDKPERKLALHRARTMDAVKNNFMCSTYKKKGKDVCSGHYIREIELAEILLDDIRRITYFVRQNEMRFAQYIGVKQGKEAQREITNLQKKLDAMTKRQSELSALFKRRYADSVLGHIPDEQYRILSNEYIAE